MAEEIESVPVPVEDPIEKLYKNAKKKLDVGDLNNFKRLLSDGDARKSIYEDLIDAYGPAVKTKIGNDFDAFTAQYGEIKKKTSVQGSPSGGQPTSSPASSSLPTSSPASLGFAQEANAPAVLPFDMSVDANPEVARKVRENDLNRQLAESSRLKELQGVYDQAQGAPIAETLQRSPLQHDTLTQGIPEAEREGNNPAASRGKYLYNQLLKGVGSIAAGLGDVMLQSGNNASMYNPAVNQELKTTEQVAGDQKALTDYRLNTAPSVRDFLVDKIGATSVDEGLKKKYENETFTAALGGLAQSAPAMAATIGSGGVGAGAMFLQSYDNAMESINQSEAGKSLDNETKTLFASSVGLATSTLEKFGLDKIFKSETGVIGNLIAQQALKKATAETGGKVTGDVLTKFLDKEILNLSNNYLKGGIKALDGALVEYTTEALQEGAQAGAELLLNKETGKPVFDTSETSNWKGFLARMNKAGIMGAIGGGLLGGVASLANLKKADIESTQADLTEVNTALNNPNLSEASQKALIQQKVKLENEVDETAKKIDETFDKLSSDQKERVIDITDRKLEIESVLNDEAVPESVKTSLAKENEQLEDELVKINPDEATVTKPDETVPVVEESVTEIPKKVTETPQEKQVVVEPEKVKSFNGEETTRSFEIGKYYSDNGTEFLVRDGNDLDGYSVQNNSDPEKPIMTVPIEELNKQNLSTKKPIQVNEAKQTPIAEEVATENIPEAIPQETVRTLDDVKANQKQLQVTFRNILKEEGLLEDAKNEKIPAEILAELRQRAEQQVGKTVEQLKAEEESFNVVEDKSAPKPKKERKPSLTEEEVSVKKELAAKFRGRLNDITGVFTTVFDKEFQKYAGLVLKEAKGDFMNFSKEIIDNVGERIREHLPRLYKQLGGQDPVAEQGLDDKLEPEVIAEVESSPEDITQENIVQFKKRLDKLLKDGKMTTLIKRGVVKATLATDAVQKVADIVDRKTMLSAARAVRAIFKDVIRNAYISQIKAAREGLKVRLSKAPLAKTDLMRKFMAIKENALELEDLEQYNSLIGKLNEQYNARMEGLVSDTDVQDFVDHIADKVAKAVLDKQVSEAEVTGEPKESARRKQLEAAVEINRQELRKGGYDPAYKDVARALLSVDTTELSNRQMVDLNLALINLGVNDRLVSHTEIYRDYVGQKGFDKLKAKVGDGINGILDSEFAASARSSDVNTKIIFKGINNSVDFQVTTGVAGISNGNSQVANIDMKSLEKGYRALVDKIKFSDFNTAENRFLRSLYANVTQFSGIGKEEADFTRYKSLIKQTAEKLMSSEKSTEKMEGGLIMQQYEEYLEPFEQKADFEANFKNKQAKNVEVVNFFRSEFASKLPEMKINTLIYGGKNLKEVNNYLPMSWKPYSKTEIQSEEQKLDIVEPVYDFDPETGDVSERQTSSVISRTNVSKIKDSGRVLNMDFDKYIFTKFRELNYDIRTLKDRHLYNAIKSQEGFNEVVGGAKNAKVLTTGVATMVKRQLGQGYVNSELAPIIRGSRVLAGKGVRQALFGVAQLFKQYPSVAIRTMINLNSDVSLFAKGFNVGMNNPIFDNFGIGLRGSTKGGTNFELELNNIRKSDFSSTPQKLWHAIDRASKITAEKLAVPLAKSDEAVAKHSWIAYYLKYIKDNGGDINKIDWETEHLNPNKSAGAYADFLVSTTQNPNDNSKQAELLYDNGDAKTIIRDVIAPFSSFARNSQANLEADLRTFSGGTPAEKKIAGWGIVSNISEQAAFNAIKVALIASLIKAGSTAIQGLFGEEPPEKEGEPMGSKIAKNTVSDVLFGGLGQMGSYWAIKGINQANKAIQGTGKDLFYQYQPAQYGEPDFGMAGIYGILPQSFYNAAQKADYLNGEVSGYYESHGQEYKATTYLSPEDQALVSTLFVMDALAIAGLSDAELSRLNQTIFRDVKKRTQPVTSFKVQAVNKKAGAQEEAVGDE